MPDWTEHSPSLLPLLGTAVVFLAGVVVAMFLHSARRELAFLKSEGTALKDTITEGFRTLSKTVDSVAERFEKQLAATWEEIKEHRRRIEAVEIDCAGRHGKGRRHSDYNEDEEPPHEPNL